MKSLLSSFRKELEPTIKLILSYYNVDIDVNDENCVRISGTGRYGTGFGEFVKQSVLAQMAIKTQKPVMIFYPAHEEPCRSCRHRSFCGNFARMVFPLFYEGTVCGMISITAVTQEQSRELQDQKERISLFMQSICDSIDLRLREKRERRLNRFHLKLQEELINAIRDGVMLLDGKDAIHYLNKRAESILGCDIHQIRHLIREKRFDLTQVKHDGAEAMYYVKIRGSRLRLIGQLMEVKSEDPDETMRAFIFADMRTLSDNLRTAAGNGIDCTFSSLIGNSRAFMETLENCRRALFHMTPLLLYGEVGSGKEIFARAIHNEGPFRNNRFIRIAHGRDLQTLLDPDAPAADVGSRYEYAFNAQLLDSVSVFIDDVENFSLEDQSIVLTIIQKAPQLHARVICATTRKLDPLVDAGSFHPELYYMLEVHAIEIPPVRERGGDTLLLADHYLESANKIARKSVSLAKEVREMLLEHPWRGNVREIETTIIHLVENVAIDEGEITRDLLPESLTKKFSQSRTSDYNLENAEKRLILNALNSPSRRLRSRAQIAKKLGISEATLYRKLKQYNISPSTRFS